MPGLVGVVELVAGGVYTCARLGDGTLRCWGGQTFIVLGAQSDGTTTQVTLQCSPQPIPGLAGVLGIAAGDNHACLILGDRTAACWGANFNGQVGDGTQGIQPDGSSTRFTPVAVLGLAGVAELVAGQAHTCARKLDGSVNCWGFNGRGQIGDGVSPETLLTSGTPLPAVVLNLTDAVQLTSGFDDACALKRDRTLVCWGANEFGQLGDGTRTDWTSPVVVVGGLIF